MNRNRILPPTAPLIPEWPSDFPGEGPQPQFIPAAEKALHPGKNVLNQLRSASLVSGSVTPRKRLMELSRLVTADSLCSGKQLKILLKALNNLNISEKEQSGWNRQLQLQLIAGKARIGVETTRQFIRSILLDCTEKTGLFVFHRPLIPGVFIILRVQKDSIEESYHAPIHATVLSAKENPLRKGEYLVRAEFKQVIQAGHGIHGHMKPGRVYPGQSPDFGTGLSPNPSLTLRYVGCPLCKETGIPFWSLKPHVLLETRNFFGLPVYHDPFPGYETCDFHLLRVTVCPCCFFSSARQDDFCPQPEQLPEFQVVEMKQRWKSQCLELKAAVHGLPKSFGTHLRTLEQGIMACEIGIETMLTLLDSGESHERRFDSTTLCLIQADLLNHLGKTKDANARRRKALELLEQPASYSTNLLRSQALLRKFLLQIYFGFNGAADTVLLELKELASIKQTERFVSQLISEALEKARRLSLQRNNDPKKRTGRL